MNDTPDSDPPAKRTRPARMQTPASKRVELGGGKWFDAERAMSWLEATNTKGSEPGTHQTLYRTRKMAWVLKRWNGGEEAKATYEQVDAGYAVRWLWFNGHRVPQPVLERDGEI